MKLYQALLWTMIGSLALTALLGVWALLMPVAGRLQEEVLLSCLLIGLYSLPAFGCAIVLHRRRDRPIMWLGIGTAVITLGIWLVGIWTHRTSWILPDELFKVGFMLTTVSLWAAHFGLLRLAAFQSGWSKMVRAATVVLGAILAVTIIIGIWTEPRDDWFFRLLGVLAILTVCGTIVTPILALIDVIAARGGRESLPSSLKIALTCPRCGSSERIVAGAGRCASCGLRIAIDVEEPRCACGYLLHKLQGENCPECGRTIPAADRWHITRTEPAGEQQGTEDQSQTPYQ
jgi:hypothetical protein